MQASCASNLKIGQDEEGEKLRSAEDLDTKKASETADKSPSDRDRHRKTLASDDSADPETLASTRRLVAIKVNQNVLNELYGSIGKLQTLVADMRTDYERRRFRRSSAGTLVYTDVERDTMDNGLRSLDIKLAMLRRKLDALDGNPVKILKMVLLFKNHEMEYRLIRTIHSNVKLKEQLVKRARRRRLEEKALSDHTEDDGTYSWMADHVCRPYRALYRWIFGSPAKEQTAR